MCIGAQFALTEATLVLATLIQAFHIERADDTPGHPARHRHHPARPPASVPVAATLSYPPVDQFHRIRADALTGPDDSFLTTGNKRILSSTDRGCVRRRDMRSQRLTMIIFIGMLLGIAVGYACHELWPDPQTAKTIAGYISLFTDVFLRLIKMIIAPLVFTTLVVGVAHMGDTKAVGRIGGKAMLWFVSASLVSLLLGLIMVNILRPGDNLNLPLPDVGAATNLNAASLSLKDFVTHLVPRSAVEAMANNEILQIVVFSLFFGVAARPRASGRRASSRSSTRPRRSS